MQCIQLQNRKSGGNAQLSQFNPNSLVILNGVGGLDNVKVIDCCATRLRLTLTDSGKVNDALLKTTGAKGVVKKGSAIQVIYGPQVTVIKSDFEECVQFLHENPNVAASLKEQVQGAAPAAAAEETGLEKKKKDGKVVPGSLKAVADGKVLPMSASKDEEFASCAMGDGIVIELVNGKVVSPVDREVSMVMDGTYHAVGIKIAEGFELLLHIGIDAVSLKGEGFRAFVSVGQKVKARELLVELDKALVESKGLAPDIMVIVLDDDGIPAMKYYTGMDASAGETVVAEW